MNRVELRELCRDFLAVRPQDPFYPDGRIDRALDIAEHELVEEIRLQAPGMMQTVVTLKASSATSNTYFCAAQVPPLTDFHQLLELRLTDNRGLELREIADDLLTVVAGAGFYSIIGPDDAPIFTTDPGVAAGTPLYCKYARKSSAWVGDAGVPESVPADFHDVIAYRAVESLFEYGSEGQFPAALARKSLDRSGALWHHLSRRSRDPQRVPPAQAVVGVDLVRR